MHVKIECKRGSSTPISRGAHEIQSLSTFGVRVKPECMWKLSVKEVSLLLFQKGHTKFNLKEVSLLLFQKRHTARQPVTVSPSYLSHYSQLSVFVLSPSACENEQKIECKRGFSTPISKGAHEIQSDRGFSTPISKGVLSFFIGVRVTVSPSLAPCIWKWSLKAVSKRTCRPSHQI